LRRRRTLPLVASHLVPTPSPCLSVVMPCYNELATIDEIVDRVLASPYTAELLIVDDGSTDGTASVAGEFLKGRRGRLLRNPENHGKGYSVRRGVLEATGRWVLMTDADLSAPITEHARLAEAVRDYDLDLAIASRGLAESRIEVRQNLVRESMGKTFNKLIRLMTGLKFFNDACERWWIWPKKGS